MSSFYSGALMMVLVTEESTPFETVREGLLAHPSWRVLLEEGNIYIFQVTKQ